MENVIFSFSTDYDMRLFISIAQVSRKTLRKKERILLYVFSAMAGILFLMKVFTDKDFILSLGNVIIAIAFVLMVVALFLQDIIEASFLFRRAKATGMRTETFFGENWYAVSAGKEKRERTYQDIVAIAETTNGIILMYDDNWYEFLPVASLNGGTIEEFCAFLESKTDKKIQLAK